MRLFAALPLSSTALERLLSLRLRLSAPGDGLRWSTPEQWHITLQFYGEVDMESAARLQTGLAGLTTPAPEITLSELGMFAAKGILFASVAPSPTLLALHAEVLRVGRDCGFPPEARPFRPHITLARSKGKTGNNTLRKLGSPSLPALGPELSFTADRCLLLESTLRPEGAHYSVKASIPLEPQADNPPHKQEP